MAGALFSTPGWTKAAATQSIMAKTKRTRCIMILHTGAEPGQRAQKASLWQSTESVSLAHVWGHRGTRRDFSQSLVGPSMMYFARDHAHQACCVLCSAPTPPPPTRALTRFRERIEICVEGVKGHGATKKKLAALHTVVQ